MEVVLGGNWTCSAQRVCPHRRVVGAVSCSLQYTQWSSARMSAGSSEWDRFSWDEALCGRGGLALAIEGEAMIDAKVAARNKSASARSFLRLLCRRLRDSLGWGWGRWRAWSAAGAGGGERRSATSTWCVWAGIEDRADRTGLPCPPLAPLPTATAAAVATVEPVMSTIAQQKMACTDAERSSFLGLRSAFGMKFQAE